MIIPEHIEHIDCPKCARHSILRQIVEGKVTDPNCPVCGGEGVIREDGKATLKTKLDCYSRPQLREGMRVVKSRRKESLG